MRKLIIVFLCCLSSIFAYSNTFYISPEGDNTNNGLSEITPWYDLEYAISMANDVYDTIFVLPGTYPVSKIINLPLGISVIGKGTTPDEVIFKAMGNDLDRIFTLHSDGINKNDQIYFLDGDQCLKNFTVDGNNQSHKGIVVTGRNYVTLHNLNVLNCIDHGIVFAAFASISTNRFYSAKIRGSQLSNCTVTECARMIPNSDDLYSSNIAIGGWYAGEMQNCVIYDRAGDNHSSGQALEHMGLLFTKVHHNTFTINTSIENKWGGIFSVLSGYSAGVEFFENTVNSGISCEHRVDEESYQYNEVKSILIYNNRFICDRADGRVPQAIELYTDNAEIYGNYFENFGSNITSWQGNDTLTNIVIHHNVFKGIGTSKGISLTMGGGSHENTENMAVYRNFYIYNNIFDQMGNAIYNPHGKCEYFHLKNNVFLNSDYTWYHSSERDANNIMFDNNLLYNCTEQNNATATFINNIHENPAYKLSGNLPVEYYSVVSQSSPIIDSGIDLGVYSLGYAGENPDLGAYEYQGNTPGRLLAPVYRLFTDKVYFGSQEIIIDNYNSTGTIIYTLDGSQPTVDHGIVYTEPLTLDASANINALIVDPDMIPSHMITANYKIFNSKAEIPIVFPLPDTFRLSSIVMLSSPEPETEIYYTLDGSIPSALTGILYDSPIYLNASTIIKAICHSNDKAPSDIAEFNYVIDQSYTPENGLVINNTNDSIYYSDHFWYYEGNRGVNDIQDDIHSVYAQDAYFEYSFNGTGVAFISELNTGNTENIEIYIDNVLQTIRSLKNDSQTTRDTVFINLNLEQGDHKIKCIKRSSEGKFVIDALIVYGNLNTGIHNKINDSFKDIIFKFDQKQIDFEYSNKSNKTLNTYCFITDLQGRVVVSRDFLSLPGYNHHNFNFNQLNSGIYIINFLSEEGNLFSNKIIIR